MSGLSVFRVRGSEKPPIKRRVRLGTVRNEMWLPWLVVFRPVADAARCSGVRKLGAQEENRFDDQRVKRMEFTRVHSMSRADCVLSHRGLWRESARELVG